VGYAYTESLEVSTVALPLQERGEKFIKHFGMEVQMEENLGRIDVEVRIILKRI
jgi:hypothetical protein